MSMSDKPQPIPNIYDYHQCRDWLQKKYGYCERDYAGKRYGPNPNPDAEYLDFWHFVVDMTDLNNGEIIVMDDSWKEDAAPWQIEIIDRYLDHFGVDQRSVKLLCEW